MGEDGRALCAGFFLVEAMGQLYKGRADNAGYMLVSVVGKVMVSEAGYKLVSGLVNRC